MQQSDKSKLVKSDASPASSTMPLPLLPSKVSLLSHSSLHSRCPLLPPFALSSGPSLTPALSLHVALALSIPFSQCPCSLGVPLPRLLVAYLLPCREPYRSFVSLSSLAAPASSTVSPFLVCCRWLRSRLYSARARGIRLTTVVKRTDNRFFWNACRVAHMKASVL